MVSTEYFFLKWRRRVQNELKEPEKWESTTAKPKWEDYVHAPRIISVAVLYWGIGEYLDPVTRKPINQVVIDVTEKERKTSQKKWIPKRRLEVRRQVWLPKNPDDRWSPVNKYNTLRLNRAQVYQDYKYSFLRNDRTIWYPEYLSFPQISDPMIMYIRVDNDLHKLWLARPRHLSFNDSDPDHGAPTFSVTQPDAINWTYPGLEEGEKPPEWIDAIGRRVNFYPDNRKPEIKSIVKIDKNNKLVGLQMKMPFRRGRK